jgi:hypothetical protein
MEAYMGLVGVGIQTVLFLLAGYAMVIRNDSSNKALKEQMASMQLEIKGLSGVVTQMAVQTVRMDGVSERMNILDRRVEDLRSGKGFIQGPRGVDHEWPEK